MSLGSTTGQDDGIRRLDTNVTDDDDDERGRFGCRRTVKKERNPSPIGGNRRATTASSIHFVAGPPIPIILSIEGGRIQAQSDRHFKDIVMMSVSGL